MYLLITSAMAGSVLLSAEVDRTTQAIRTLTPETCTATLEGAYTDLERLRLDEVDGDDVATHGARTVQRVFDARLALHEQLRAQHAAGTLTPDCLRSMRRIDLAGRYLSDTLLEVLPADATDGWVTAPGAGFAGLDDLRTGDVLVTRGSALSSAGIAHMGRIDAQFSHNVLVWVDPDTGRAHTIEAYLERGAITQPLERLLAHGVDRIVVLRHRDPALAARAAQAAHARVARGPKIDYDTDFDAEDHEALFCSEVPGWAFGALVGRTGPEDAVPIAMARSAFPQDRNPSMFGAMGVAAASTSAPADVLFDPRFDLVAEWRDVANVETMRRQDAAVEAVLGWMEDGGYTLAPQPEHRRLVGFGLTVRRIPGVGQALAHKIHPRGDRAFLVASLALQDATTAVYEDLEAALGERAAPTTYAELRAELERLRRADLATHAADPRRARYHGILQPPASDDTSVTWTDADSSGAPLRSP